VRGLGPFGGKFHVVDVSIVVGHATRSYLVALGRIRIPWLQQRDVLQEISIMDCRKAEYRLLLILTLRR
jgi:hypothetical protein